MAGVNPTGADSKPLNLLPALEFICFTKIMSQLSKEQCKALENAAVEILRSHIRPREQELRRRAEQIKAILIQSDHCLTPMGLDQFSMSVAIRETLSSLAQRGPIPTPIRATTLANP